MKRFLAIIVWLTLAGNAFAAQVPAGFVGVNYGGDVTVAPGTGTHGSGVYPVYTLFDRIYDASVGTTFHATWWSTLNPSAGVYNWTPLDAILYAEQSKGKVVEYTLSGVPAYVNGSQNVTGGTQQAQFTTFLTAMMQHIAANKQCFGYFSMWNEVNQASTYWVGTAADMATLNNLAYPIIKTNCPGTVVLSASITAGVDSGASPNPNGPFQYWNAYLASSAGFVNGLDVHGYPLSPSLQTANASVTLAPELIINSITNAKAIGSANGLGSLPLYLDEGYAASDPASGTTPANTDAYAQAQAQQIIIAAGNGVSAYANSFFGDGCINQTACGNEFVSSPSYLNLTKAGLAKRQIVSWLSGATFVTPYARTVGTNLIIVAPNDGSVATGIIGGSGGAGCPSPPVGTGSLPTGWALSATASIAGGMSYYVVADGTSGGLAYQDDRLCGTDTGGANFDQIRMNNFSGAATVGQNVVISACLGLAAGTLNGIQEIDLQINEYAAGPSYANQFMVQGQIQPVSTTTVPIASQCFQTRYVMQASNAAFAVPYVLIKHYGAVPIDATIRIAAPRLEVNATQWSGTITKSGGYQAVIASNASGSGTYTAPVGTKDWRDIYGAVHKVSAGASIPLGVGPVLVENTLPEAYLPATTAGFFVNPAGGGVDLFAGTITAPFATLNKCHTAMQAGSTKTCYVRGAVTAASWTQGSGETWRNYPGDAAYSTNITITGSTTQNIGCTSCSNVTTYGLKITGTGTAGSLFGYYQDMNIFVQDCHLSTTGAEQIVSDTNWINNRFQGNTYTSPSTNGVDQMSLVVNDSSPHDGLYVTDSTFTNLARINVEILNLSAQLMTNVHVDRDTFGGTIDSGAIEAITMGGSGLVGENNNTMYGNTITFPSNSNNNVSGIELAMAGTTVSYNEIDYTAFPLSVAKVPGSAIFSNTIKIPLSNTAANPSGPASFSQGGTYNQSEWIGSNIIVGSGGTNTVTGCSGLGFPPISPGYCAIISPPTYGSPPPFYPPSPVWSQ